MINDQHFIRSGSYSNKKDDILTHSSSSNFLFHIRYYVYDIIFEGLKFTKFNKNDKWLKDENRDKKKCLPDHCPVWQAIL